MFKITLNNQKNQIIVTYDIYKVETFTHEKAKKFIDDQYFPGKIYRENKFIGIGYIDVVNHRIRYMDHENEWMTIPLE